jgi:DNA-directed RNA polymerase specialized sigma24 family protein
MNPNQYIQQNYENIKLWLKGVTLNETPHLYDDFIQEIVIIFLQHPKAQEAIDTGTVRYFLTRIALNQWRSKTSPFHYQYRHRMTEEFKDNNASDEVYDVNIDMRDSRIFHALEQMYNTKRRYEVYIIILYHTLNNNYSAVARYLKMEPTTIRKIYLRGIKILKQTINNGNNNIINNNRDIHSDSFEFTSLPITSKLFKTEYFKLSK